MTALLFSTAVALLVPFAAGCERHADSSRALLAAAARELATGDTGGGLTRSGREGGGIGGQAYAGGGYPQSIVALVTIDYTQSDWR